MLYSKRVPNAGGLGIKATRLRRGVKNHQATGTGQKDSAPALRKRRRKEGTEGGEKGNKREGQEGGATADDHDWTEKDGEGGRMTQQSSKIGFLRYCPGATHISPRRPKSAPGWPENPPGQFQLKPKRPQRRPRRPPQRLQSAQTGLLELIFMALTWLSYLEEPISPFSDIGSLLRAEAATPVLFQCDCTPQLARLALGGACQQ